jgi:hypothetical protein
MTWTALLYLLVRSLLKYLLAQHDRRCMQVSISLSRQRLHNEMKFILKSGKPNRLMGLKIHQYSFNRLIL